MDGWIIKLGWAELCWKTKKKKSRRMQQRSLDSRSNIGAFEKEEANLIPFFVVAVGRHRTFLFYYVRTPPISLCYSIEEFDG
jgi:hypothetical protein